MSGTGNILHKGNDLKAVGERVLSDYGWSAILRWVADASASDLAEVAEAGRCNGRSYTRSANVREIAVRLRAPSKTAGLHEYYRRGQMIHRLERKGALNEYAYKQPDES